MGSVPNGRTLQQRTGGLLILLALLAPWSVTPVGAGSTTMESPSDAVAVDSILVLTPYVSPNADGVLDELQVRYALEDTTTLRIHVSPVASAETTAVLLDSTLAVSGRRTFTTTWDGRTTLGATAADGRYEVVFEATPSGAPTVVNRRQFVVDTTTPVVEILDVSPRRYAPTQPGSPPSVRVRLRVQQSQIEDTLETFFLVPAGADFDTLHVPLVDAFAGDGDYVARCTACADPDSLPDGVFTLQASMVDRAGNASAATDSLDNNLRGPKVRLTHPFAGTRFATTAADSLVGEAIDRHPTTALTLHVTGPDSFDLAVPVRAVRGDTATFFVDLSGPLAADGDYQLEVEAADVDGVTDSLTLEYIVDTVPPRAPVLDPRPARIQKSEFLPIVLDVDDDTDRIWRQGGVFACDTCEVTSRPWNMGDLRLLPGANPLSFRALDLAGNLSPAETLTVVWETTTGLAIPERFEAGNAIQVDVGDTPASRVEVRVVATDGTLVQRFRAESAQLVYSFPWDLRTPEGAKVRNGPYLVVVRITYPDGRSERFRGMTAVIE